jgi:hypothetical protein
MKQEQREQLLRTWKQLHVDIALLKLQIDTLLNTVGQQDYSSLKFNEKAAIISNKLCKLQNDIFTADTKNSKSILGVIKGTLQLQNDLSESIKTIRNYGESLRSESVNLLQIKTRVDMLMSYLDETQNKISKPSALEKFNSFAKTAAGTKRKASHNENLAIQPEAPSKTRRK